MPITIEPPVATGQPDDDRHSDDDIKNMYTSEEVARYLGFTVKTIQRLARRGELKGYFILGHWRFKWGDVNAFIEKHRK